MSEVDYSEFFYEADNERDSPARNNVIKPHTTREKPSRGRAISVLAVIVCFCLTLLSVDYLSGGYVLAEFDKDAGLTLPESDYYAVQTGMYTDSRTAELYAESIKRRGGAGYVYYDGLYRVIASVYKSAVDARNVADKMGESGTDATVIPLSVPPASDSSLSSSDRNALFSASGYSDYCYTLLYEASNKIDSAGFSEGELTNLLSSLISYLESEKEKVDRISYSQSADSLSASILGATEIIKSVPPSPASSDLRYAYTAIIAGRLS